jgi:hypothetical protein
MKKLFILSATVLLFAVNANSQCVPGTDFDGTGLTLSPFNLEPVYACAGCGDHSRVISVQTFADTMLSVEVTPGNPPLDVTVFADRFRLDSIGGLPMGLTYTTDAAFDTTFDAVENPFGYWINPGDTTNGFTNTTGCISIEGDAAAWTAAIGGGPNNDGVYPLTVYIDARAASFSPIEIADVVGLNTWLTDMGFLLDAFGDPNFTANGIRLEGVMLQVVESGVGVEEVDGLSNLNVIPNPSSGLFNISLKNENLQQAQLQVISVTGSVVIDRTENLMVGNNRIELDPSGVDSGVYILNLSTKNGQVNRKIIVE